MSRGRSGAAILATIACAGALAFAFPLASAAGAAVPTIIFTKSARNEQVGQLWSIREDGANPRMLRRRMPVGPEGAIASLARDRRHLFCICRRGEIDSVDLHGRHLRRIGSQPHGTRYDVVTIGPNGDPFWVDRANRIYTQRGDGPPRLVLWSRNSVVDERVVPNPAGTRLAFVRYGCLGLVCQPGDAVQVRTVGVDGSGPRTVYVGPDDREIEDLSWSADGRRLVLFSTTPFEKPPAPPVEFEYLVVNASGSNPHQVAQLAPLGVSRPFFSPDGTRFAVSNYASGGYERLDVMGLDGSGLETVFKGTCRWPACEFSPRAIAWTTLPRR